jgi:lipopolysaccharide export system protein LptA
MRFTIERIRMLVVAAAVILLVALGIFLAMAKLRNRFTRRDLPQRLARDIQQEANGFTFVHAFGAHSQYKIHASKEVQLRDNRVMLQDVRIELFGQDGSRVDEIAGDEFEYDQKSGLAIAAGPVEMDLTQPANAAHAEKKPGAAAGGNAAPDQNAAPAGNEAPPKQIHVKTSGVTFDQDTGQVTTVQRVEFSMAAGGGSSMGASYDAQNGYLILDHAVELETVRGGEAVKIHAQHAELDRGAQVCRLRAAAADYRGAQTSAAQATISFRKDGTTEKLDASGGFTLATASGGHMGAPTATMEFDEHSQPLRGRLEGGVAMDSVKEGRTVHGIAPTAELEFAGKGELRHAHLERGVVFTSQETGQESGENDANAGSAQGGAQRVTRTWHSPVADVDFRDAGKGQVEPASLHGTAGVVITSESQRGSGPVTPAKMSADDVTGSFGPKSTLRSLTGVGRAGIEQTTASGTKQTANGDRLIADFAQADAAKSRDMGTKRQGSGIRDQGSEKRMTGEQRTDEAGNQVESSEIDGHVLLFEQPAAKSGQAQAPIRATAGKAVYESAGEWLHLTMSPRVENGGLELTADKVDVSQQSGDAFAHGNVKASWSGGATGGTPGRAGKAGGGSTPGAMAFGGNGPAHVIANEAQMNESTGEATFRGHARLWQQANSVSAPVIVLNQHQQTMEARTTSPDEPVRAVMLSAGGAPGTGSGVGRAQGQNGGAGSKAATPSVIRVRGGDLFYSDQEHRAVMHSGVAEAVIAETGGATSASEELDLRLMPSGANGGQTQVDRMTARGHVVLTSQSRRGTGEELEYSGVSGDYVLTGTAAAPPRMSDPQQGNVTGQALIFHSRDDSVSIEGGGHETKTETTAPEAHGK